MTHEYIEHLLEDHAAQRRLGFKLRTATDPKERTNLLQEFYNEVYPHMIGEEASLFAYLKSAGGETKQEALKGEQEHYAARTVLRELMDLSPDGDVFMAKASVLDEMNRHHMEEEELRHFVALERMANKSKLDELFEQYEQAEEEVEE